MIFSFAPAQGSSLVAANTSQVISTIRPRTYFEIRNTSAGDLWMQFGSASATVPAVIDQCIKLAAGDRWTSPFNAAPAGAISIIGGTLGQKFVFWDV